MITFISFYLQMQNQRLPIFTAAEGNYFLLYKAAHMLSENKHTPQPLNPVPMDPRTHHSMIESLN